MVYENTDNSDAAPTGVRPGRARGRGPGDLVPGWLAALVLVLLLAVFAAAGFLVRGTLEGRAGTRVAPPPKTRISVLERQVEQTPDDLQARLALGYAYQTDQRLDDAARQYDVVLESEPHNTAALYNKGAVQLQQGDDKAAEKTLWKVLEAEPDHVLAAKALGEVYAARGQYRSLLVAVGPAAKAEPSMADLQYLMGLGYEKVGDAKLAVDYYRQAISYAPDMKEARAGLERLGAGR